MTMAIVVRVAVGLSFGILSRSAHVRPKFAMRIQCTRTTAAAVSSLSRPDGGIGPIEKYAYHPTAYSAHTSKSTSVPVPLPLIGVHSQCYVVVVNLSSFHVFHFFEK